MKIKGIPVRQFVRDLSHEISEDNVFNGAAALGYYLTLAIFPAMILLLTLVPYLPIPNIDREIMSLLKQAMPDQAAETLSTVVQSITSHKSTGLLSFGILATLWAASSGTYAIMQQLNITYDVKEARPFLKARGISIGLTLLLGVLMITSVALIVAGGAIQDWAAQTLNWGMPLVIAFTILRWTIIAAGLLTTFAVTYYFGPDVKQKFSFITPGSIIGATVLVASSLLFRLYVTKFNDYSAAYGSLGAAIVLMVWLYITGLVMLLGSEVNALLEHYSSEGKNKGEKKEPTHNVTSINRRALP